MSNRCKPVVRDTPNRYNQAISPAFLTSGDFILHYYLSLHWKGGNLSYPRFLFSLPIMNHFLHLLILLPALFTTITALPTAFDDTSNSWTDSTLDTSDTLLAGTFSGPSISSPLLTSPSTPAGTQTEKLTPEVTADQDWSKPLFLCCTNDRWWIDDEKHCDISMEYIQLGATGKVI